MRIEAEVRLREIVADLGGDRVVAGRFDHVPIRGRDRHTAALASIAEGHLAAGRVVRSACRSSLGTSTRRSNLRALTRVDALAECRRAHVVLVLAVLAVEQLRGDHDRRRLVEQCDLHVHDREVAVLEADEAFGPDPDALAARRPPEQFAVRDARAEVEDALVVIEIGSVEQERFVVDVELQQLGVGHVHDRLARSWRTQRLPRRVRSARSRGSRSRRCRACAPRAPPRDSPACRCSRCRSRTASRSARGRAGSARSRRAATARPGIGGVESPRRLGESSSVVLIGRRGIRPEQSGDLVHDGVVGDDVAIHRRECTARTERPLGPPASCVGQIEGGPSRR